MNKIALKEQKVQQILAYYFFNNYFNYYVILNYSVRVSFKFLLQRQFCRPTFTRNKVLEIT